MFGVMVTSIPAWALQPADPRPNHLPYWHAKRAALWLARSRGRRNPSQLAFGRSTLLLCDRAAHVVAGINSDHVKAVPVVRNSQAPVICIRARTQL